MEGHSRGKWRRSSVNYGVLHLGREVFQVAGPASDSFTPLNWIMVRSLGQVFVFIGGVEDNDSSARWC